MSDHNQAESAAPELKPCPMCGGAAHLTNGYATDAVWEHGVFYRVFCGACQIRQLFHRTEAEAVAAWNRRAPAVGEDGLPPLPHKIGTVYNGNYWTQSDTVNPPGERLADVYTAEQVRQAKREAVAANRRAREVTVSDYGNPVGKSVSTAQDVKTWQERMYTPNADGMLPENEEEAMQAEIAELRAKLRRHE